MIQTILHASVLAAHSSSSRFSFQSKEKYAEMSTPFVPENTKRLMNGHTIISKRGMNVATSCFLMIRVPQLSLSRHLGILRLWRTGLARYACETRNVSGGKYLATTISPSSLHCCVAVML